MESIAQQSSSKTEQEEIKLDENVPQPTTNQNNNIPLTVQLGHQTVTTNNESMYDIYLERKYKMKFYRPKTLTISN